MGARLGGSSALWALAFAACVAACSGGVSGSGAASSSRATASAALGPAVTATPPPSATAPVSGSASAPLPGSSAAPASDPGGFESAEALSKAVVAAVDAHDGAAARALYPGDAVIDAFATCKAARNLKSRLKLRRDAGLAGGKDEKLEWLALDRVPSPKRRKKGAEKDGCVFKEEIAIYALRVRVSVTKGGKPKKKWKKLDALVFEGRWYLASEI